MVTYIMTEAENLLAELIWEKEPIRSGELVKMAAQRFGQGGVYKQKGRAVSAGEPQRLPAEFRGRIFKEKEAQQKRYRGAGDTDRGV